MVSLHVGSRAVRVFVQTAAWVRKPCGLANETRYSGEDQ